MDGNLFKYCFKNVATLINGQNGKTIVFSHLHVHMFHGKMADFPKILLLGFTPPPLFHHKGIYSFIQRYLSKCQLSPVTSSPPFPYYRPAWDCHGDCPIVFLEFHAPCCPLLVSDNNARPVVNIAMLRFLSKYSDLGT